MSQNEINSGLGNDEDSQGKRVRRGDVQAKIRRSVQNGLSREQILLQLCREQNLFKLNSIVQAAQLFQKFDCDSTVPEDLTDVYRSLAQLISTEFVRFYRTIATLPNANTNCAAFCFVDSRYALCLGDDGTEQRLFLVDNFHGQKKMISIRDGKLNFPRTMEYVLENIDFYHILVIKKNNDVDRFEINLLRLDYNQLTGTLMSNRQINGDYFYTFFDYKNRFNFGIYAFTDDNRRVLTLVNVDRCFQFAVKPKPIEFEEELCCGRLDGRKFMTLFPKTEDDGQTGEEFAECKLVPGRNFPEFQKLFNVSAKGDGLGNFVSLTDYWSKTSGYLVGYDDKIKLYVLFIADLEKKMLSRVNLNCYHPNENVKFHMDEEQYILTLCVEDTSDQTPMVCRFTLKKPDSLINLTLFGLRRQAIFNNCTMYKQLAHQLPNSLQPMQICEFPSESIEEPRRKSRRLK